MSDKVQRNPLLPPKSRTPKPPMLSPAYVERIERYEADRKAKRKGKQFVIEFQLLINNRPPKPPWDKRLPLKRKKPKATPAPSLPARRKRKPLPFRTRVDFLQSKDIALTDRFFYSSNFIVQIPSLQFIERLMISYITNVARKGGADPDDITILAHGFVLRPLLQNAHGTGAVSHLRDYLTETAPQSTLIQHIRESREQDMFRIVFPLGPLGNMNAALSQSELIHETLVGSLDTFRVHFEDLYWSYFIETEEEIYERKETKKKRRVHYA